MTDAPTPVVLRHGKLTADMVPLLKAGSSVLRRIDGRISVHGLAYEGGVSGTYLDGSTHANSPPSHFTYIGERDADGWIHAPEGGWTENPVPGMRVALRSQNYEGSETPSDSYPWDTRDIIAFRLSEDQGSSPAAIPTEGVTASGDGHPTPVGGLEPVAWRARIRPDGAWLRLEQDYVSLRADDPAIEVDPLYSSSSVSTIQAENERLRAQIARLSPGDAE